MTTSDLRAIAGAPSDIHAIAVNDAHIFQDPDPRGPCGQRLSQPDLSSGAGITIDSTTMAGFEFVVRETASTSDGYVAAFDADSRAGCPSYQTRNNRGGVQTNVFVSRVSVQTVADRQAAALVRLIDEGRASFAFEYVVRVGDRLGVAVLLTGSAPPAPLLRAFAAEAAHRMREAE